MIHESEEARRIRFVGEMRMRLPLSKIREGLVELAQQSDDPIAARGALRLAAQYGIELSLPPHDKTNPISK
jgi:hypothetical protein